METLRGIVTQEIEEYVFNALDRHDMGDIFSMIQSIDKSAYECIRGVVNKIVEDRASHIVAILDRVNASEHDKKDAVDQIRIATTNGCLCGWFIEHAARNTLELRHAPSLVDYIDICNNAQGKIDRLQQLISGQKKRLNDAKSNTRAETYENFMNVLEQEQKHG